MTRVPRATRSRTPSPYRRPQSCAFERRRGRPFAKPAARSWKLEPHEPRIRELIAQDKSNHAIARELGLSHSSVADFVRRRGLRTTKGMWAAWRMGPHEGRIRELILGGKSDSSIARELGMPKSSVNKFVKRRGLRESGADSQRQNEDISASSGIESPNPARTANMPAGDTLSAR